MAIREQSSEQQTRVKNKLPIVLRILHEMEADQFKLVLLSQARASFRISKRAAPQQLDQLS